MMQTILFITGGVSGIFFLMFALVSVTEREFRAARRSVLLALLFPLPFVSVTLLTGPAERLISILLLSFTFSGIVLLLIPFRKKSEGEEPSDLSRYDERFTMFSRRELTHRPTEAAAFYAQNPELESLDQFWRRKPGLMSKEATQYNPLVFNAAEAGFFTIEMLRSFVHEKCSAQKININPEKLSQFIYTWAKKLGAVNVGICETRPYHFYSHRGQGSDYGKKVEPAHQMAIAITVEMDKEMLATGPAGPALMESATQYLNSGTIAIRLARFLQNLGYNSRAHIDGNYEVICPLVARDAGLGEIGRMGLLMTPEIGPRVRISVVTTDAPLTPTEKRTDPTVQQFCDICKKCAEVCPAQAIPKSGRIRIDGVNRWQIDHAKCFGYWCSTGTDCGRCMHLCPYSHPGNFFHNTVRRMIKNSALFRRFALEMDNYFYGKKPKPARVPGWMEA